MYFTPRNSELDENAGRYRMENTVMEMNRALEFVGDNSRYQKRCLFLLSSQWLIYSLIVFVIPFFLPLPFSYTCKLTSDTSDFLPDAPSNSSSVENTTNETLPEDNSSIALYNCTMETACKDDNLYEAHYSIGSSISEDFSLYCHKVYLISLMQTVYFSSTPFPMNFLPFLSPRFRRDLQAPFLEGTSALFLPIGSGESVFSL